MVQPVFLLLLVAFGGSAIGCAVGLRRAWTISDSDTRLGLSWLLGTAGAWATLQIGYLVVPGSQVKLKSSRMSSVNISPVQVLN